MSSLRDARFEKALASAPDVDDVAAPAAVRAAIREAAHRAVARPPRVPWWTTLLAGDARMPWNAAFATVLLAGVVTLLWRGGGELPRDGAAAERPSLPVTAPAPSQPASEPAPRAESAPSAAAEARPAPPAPPTRAPAAVAAPRAPQRPPPSAVVAPGPPAAPAAPARSDAALAEKAAVSRQEAERTEARAQADATTSMRARPLPPPASPPPPPAAARPPFASFAAPVAPAPAPPAMLARGSESSARPVVPPQPTVGAMPAWETVRVEAGTRAVSIPRPQAEALASSIAGLLSAPRESAGPAPARTQAQLTLLQDTRTVGQLWLGDGRATWQPAGEPAVTWQPDAAQLAALREQVRQLLER